MPYVIGYFAIGILCAVLFTAVSIMFFDEDDADFMATNSMILVIAWPLGVFALIIFGFSRGLVALARLLVKYIKEVADHVE